MFKFNFNVLRTAATQFNLTYFRSIFRYPCKYCRCECTHHIINIKQNGALYITTVMYFWPEYFACSDTVYKMCPAESNEFGIKLIKAVHVYRVYRQYVALYVAKWQNEMFHTG